MFQSTLLKRTMSLVVLSLVASAILATIAFVVAGRLSTMSSEVDNATQIDLRYKEIFTNHPEYLESVDFRLFFFESTYPTGHDYYLLNANNEIVNATSLEHRSIGPSITADLFPSLNSHPYDDLNGLQFYIDDYNNVVISRFPVVIYENTYYLYSFTPAYAFVSRMVLPLQKINEVAMEYGKGNFSIRADESHKGEIGELGQSFNFLADRLSKSISDLTAERNQLQDIFDVISDGIVVVDSKAVPVTTNKAIHKIFDRAEKNNMFTERLQLIPFDDVWSDFEECIATGETKTRQIDTRDYAYQCTIIPKYDSTDNTKVIGATGFIRDIFEEQKNERFRQDYVANISHELRTPLQTLRGLIEPLSDGMVKKESDRQRYYQIILNETMRLSRLIDDMLELSKLQSRTLAFKMFPFNLNNLISNIEIRFKPIMKEAGIKFSVQNNYGELPTVMGNPDRVEQILVILLDNAKKYTPNGKSITILTDYIEAEKKVYISVADTGQGIHEYDIGHIFDRFFKADRARGKKGSGLGLSIAKELLTYMGETITVDSKYEEGSTFTFTLTKAEVPDVWD